MSWLCDVCGYENEYSEDVKTTTCLCCGEPASERKIQQAYKDLVALQKEAERRARAEKLRQQQQLRQQRINRIFENSKSVIKGISIATIVLIALSTVWLGISMHSDGLSLSAWKQHMVSNMSSVAVVSNVKVYRDNISEIQVYENTQKAMDISGKIIHRNISNHFDTAKDNNSIINRFNWSLFGKRLPYLTKNIKEVSKNFASNWDSFCDQANRNIELLIKAIKERNGKEA